MKLVTNEVAASGGLQNGPSGLGRTSYRLKSWLFIGWAS